MGMITGQACSELIMGKLQVVGGIYVQLVIYKREGEQLAITKGGTDVAM